MRQLARRRRPARVVLARPGRPNPIGRSEPGGARAAHGPVSISANHDQARPPLITGERRFRRGCKAAASSDDKHNSKNLRCCGDQVPATGCQAAGRADERQERRGSGRFGGAVCVIVRSLIELLYFGPPPTLPLLVRRRVRVPPGCEQHRGAGRSTADQQGARPEPAGPSAQLPPARPS
jgi:hypothetical protein